MSITKTNLKAGPAQLTWNGATVHLAAGFGVPHAPTWRDVVTETHGKIARVKTDLIIPIRCRLAATWENLSVFFPAAYLTPGVGTLLNTTDLPLVIQAKDTTKITYHNAILTKMANLHLGPDSDIYSADCEFAAILADAKNPGDSGAYYTVATGTWTDNFALTNYKAPMVAAAWGSVTGFTAIAGQKGWDISWELDLNPIKIEGLGTVTYIIAGLRAQAACIPSDATIANIETAAGATGVLGALLGATQKADLALTASGLNVTLKNASILSHGYDFSVRNLRNQQIVWETTQNLAAACAVVATS